MSLVALVGSVVINAVTVNPNGSGSIDMHRYSVIRNLKSVNGLHLSVQVPSTINCIFMDVPAPPGATWAFQLF